MPTTMPTLYTVPLGGNDLCIFSNPYPNLKTNSTLNVSVFIVFFVFFFCFCFLFLLFVICYCHCVFVISFRRCCCSSLSLFIFILNASFVALCGLGLLCSRHSAYGLLACGFFSIISQQVENNLRITCIPKLCLRHPLPLPGQQHAALMSLIARENNFKIAAFSGNISNLAALMQVYYDRYL